MRNLLFGLLLFASCSNVTVKGQLRDFTAVDGQATFTLGGQMYKDVSLLPSAAIVMTNSCGQNVEVEFYEAAIVGVHLVKDDSTFNRWALIVLAITITLAAFAGQLPTNRTNIHSNIQGGNYGGESWWSNRL